MARSWFLLLLFEAAGIFEAGLGLLQLTGVCYSGNMLHTMTGTFDNPGPFGGFVAMCLAVAAGHLWDMRKREWPPKVVPAVCAILCLLVLPASLSRAAWIAATIAATVFCLTKKEIKEVVFRKKYLATIISFSLVLLATGGFFLKKDSALGRLHIWRIECRVIARNPFGVGPGKEMGAYGLEQASFFSKKERSPLVKRIAGCPEYAFNEYLKYGMRYGVIGLVLALAISLFATIRLLRLKSPLAYSMIVLAVFAFASYPLSIPLFQIAFALMLAAAAIPLKGKNRSHILFVNCFVAVAVFSIGVLAGNHFGTENFRSIYETGYALHKECRYDESTAILERGARISCDPMFHNIIGKNYCAMGCYDLAEEEFYLARNMVPSRLYPLILLMRMYDEIGKEEFALAAANTILAMPVNSKNRNMADLHAEAAAFVESHENKK